MAKSVFSKVVRAGKAGALMVGLVVMLALVLGVGTTAMGATGGNFILGKANLADRVSKLTASIAGPALTLVNQSTESAATALNISVAEGNAPLKVNATAGTATNLSADKLDGKDSDQFAAAVGGKAADAFNADRAAIAADAEKLDGKDSTEFAAGVNGKATNAAHADQADSATSAQNAENATSAQNAVNAQNAAQLGGKDPSQYAQISKLNSTTNAITGQGPLPKQGTFTSNGGTLLVSAAGSGFRASGSTTSNDGVIGMLIYVDGQFRDSAAVYTNGADSHKAFVNADFTLDLPAGTHTIRLEPWTNSSACGTPTETNFNACTTTDSGDFFSVSILEIP